MKPSKIKRVAAIVGGILIYLALLDLLVWVESGRQEATITSLPAALWYSLVTLTTVGYGDMSPLTLSGRLIGLVFLLMSTGLLAALVSLGYSALSSGIMPLARLWLGRKKRWYVFSTDNDAARALAAHLKDGLVVFCRSSAPLLGWLHLNRDPGRLFGLPYAGAGERLFFAMDPDASVNVADLRAVGRIPSQCYSRGEGSGDALWFSEYECTARLYWHLRPWKPSGERVVLLGSGRYGRAILNQGLLTAPPGCRFELFGDWTLWRSVHHQLQSMPSLSFPDLPWQADNAALAEADRIVICFDDRCECREALTLIQRYYVTRGCVNALFVPDGSGQRESGAMERLFTPELVMRREQDRLGRQLHELYKRHADSPMPEWETLSDFARRSNLAAADHLLTKLRLLLPEADIREITREHCAAAYRRYVSGGPELREACRRIEHDRWMLFHALYNWRYAPQRCDARREHPMMVPYEQLSEKERQKDESAWDQLGLLAEEGEL